MPATVPDVVGYPTGRETAARIVALVIAAVSAVVLAAGAVLWSSAAGYADEVERIAVFGDERPPSSANGSVDVLFVATDQGQGPKSALLRVVLVHLSRRHATTVLVHLPTDSLLRVPGHDASDGEEGKDGEARRPLSSTYEQGGARLLVQTLEQATSIHIDRYVEVSVPALADAITDLDVCLPTAVHGKEIDLDAGEHELSGAQAAALVRAAPGGDLAQVRRLQLLAGAVDSTLLGTGAVFSPFATHQLLDVGVHALRVDRGFDTAATRRLALALRDPYAMPATIVSVPVAARQKTKHGTGTRWNDRLATYLFDQLHKDKEIAPLLFTPTQVSVRPRDTGVRVRNGTGVSRLASKVSKDLAGIGFHVTAKPSNAKQDAPITLIYHDAKRTAKAKALQAAIPGSQLKRLDHKSRSLVLVVGENYAGVRPVTYVKGAESGDVNEARQRIETTGPCGD
ncbi:MAG: LCP family protein [Streptosporangiales bacterium]